MGLLERAISRIQFSLPRGQTLPDDVWKRRHRGILALLWFHAFALPIFAITQGYGVGHSILEGSLVAAVALLASLPNLPRKARAGLVSLGLLTSSALLVHFSGGYIEAHFHFFVMIAVLTLYEDWIPFLVAVAYVVVHHGLARRPGSQFGFQPRGGTRRPLEVGRDSRVLRNRRGHSKRPRVALERRRRHRLTPSSTRRMTQSSAPPSTPRSRPGTRAPRGSTGTPPRRYRATRLDPRPD